MEAKLELARLIVRRSHGERGGRSRPRRTSPASCARGRLPTTSPKLALPDGDPVHLPALIAAGFGLSTSEARRMIAQGGVKLDGAVVHELDVSRGSLGGSLLQVGKRRFARIDGHS